MTQPIPPAGQPDDERALAAATAAADAAAADLAATRAQHPEITARGRFWRREIETNHLVPLIQSLFRSVKP